MFGDYAYYPPTRVSTHKLEKIKMNNLLSFETIPLDNLIVW